MRPPAQGHQGRVIECSPAINGTLIGAALFAAAHPDRVHGLILANTGAKYLEDPTFPPGVPAANAETVVEAIEHGWGTDAFAALLASDDPSEHAAIAVLQRASASPSLAAAQFRMVLEADLREVAAAVSAPTVVFHRVDHPFVPVGLGRDLAGRITGAGSSSCRVAVACSTGPTGPRSWPASPSW